MRSRSIRVWTGRTVGSIAGVLYGLILFFPQAYQNAAELLWTILALVLPGTAMVLLVMLGLLRQGTWNVVWLVFANALLTTTLVVVLLTVIRPQGLAVLLGLLIGFLVGTAIGAAFCRLCADRDSPALGGVR